MRFASFCALWIFILLCSNPIIADSSISSEKSSETSFNPLPEVFMGNKKAPVEIIMYFSPTCNHCAEYELNFLPEIKEKFIDSGQIRFIMRLMPFHKLDYVVAKLIWNRSNEDIIRNMQFFLAHQKEWLDPVLEDSKKRGKLLSIALSKTAESSGKTVQELKDILDIPNHIETGFLKLFALRNGFSIKEIRQAFEEDPDWENSLALNHLQAEKDFGKPLDYVPAFLINGKVVKEWPKAESIQTVLRSFKN